MAIESRRIKELFVAAIELPDAAARAAYLDRECGDDAELRQRLDALLQAHDASSALEQPLSGERTGDYQSRAAGFIPAVVPGTVIAGKYKLLELIGEGGMGSVWMAQQTEPVKRHVAVKLIKAGMDSKQVIARFEAERQALAVMDHPNIAKILDGGVTERGSPYFVMELVKGVPITMYCDVHKLTPRQRLELFVPVCQAIQHAHQKGIIHRDIKPSNVMVALYDDKPIPKVIDFGVAKAMGQSLTDQSLHTGFGGIAGTPEYMSPEQASLNNLDIDTRSDIYSLGVLLYELLVGSPPFKRKDLEQAGMLEMLRVIREEEPPRPSTKLSTADALPSLSANRGTEPKKLTGILRNELDWIVMKALEKDRARRYETANGFAADINCYLAGEPVNAHPPSTAYRFKKFLWKNRGPVLASTAVAAALLVGIVGFAWQARVAQGERDVAKEERNRAVIAEGKADKRADELKIAEAETKKRAEELKKVSVFQAKMLEQVDPTQAGKLLSDDVRAKFEAALVTAGVPEGERAAQVATFTENWQRVNATDAARELIDSTILRPAVVAIDKQFGEQPLVAATLRHHLAARYGDMGLYDAAMPLEKQALATRRRELGEEHIDTLESVNIMGFLLQAQRKLDEAEPLVRNGLEKCRRALGEDHPDTLAAINNLAATLMQQRKLEEAEPLYREALAKYRRVLGEEDPGTLWVIMNMGLLLKDQGKLSESEPYQREALEKRRRTLGEEHPDTLFSIHHMASLLLAQRNFTEAESYHLESLDKNRRVHGELHPRTISSINAMRRLLEAQGKLDKAETYLREALEKNRRVWGNEHPDTNGAIHNLGNLLLAQGKLNEAEPYLREILEKNRRMLGEENTYTLMAINDVSRLLQAQGKLNEAVLLLEPALIGIEKRKFQEQRAGVLIMNAGTCYEKLKEFEKAEAWRRKWLAEVKKKAKADSPEYEGALYALGLNLLQQKKYVEVEPILRECLAIRETKYPDAWPTFDVKSKFGDSLLGQQKFAAAERLLIDGYEGLKRREDKIPPQVKIRLKEALERLVHLYTAWHAAEPDKGYDAKAAEWKAKLDAMKTPSSLPAKP